MNDSVTRRDFLKVSTMATVTAAAGATLRAADDLTSGDIDAHSHIWTRDVARYPLANGQTVDDLKPPSFTAEELLDLAGKNGVSQVVLIQHKPYHGLDNSYITDTIAKYPGRFSGVACIEAAAERPQDEMQRLAKLGIRGFRIRPGEGGTARWIDAPGMNAMWAYAAESGLAICPLINPEDLVQVDAMCQKHAGTRVVIDHFARVGIDGAVRDSDLDRLCSLAKHPHVHVKISAFYALGKKQPPHTELIPMIRRLCDAYSVERLMWASDSPYQVQPPNTYADSLRLVRERLDFLSDADRRWLLRGTAAKIYFG